MNNVELAESYWLDRFKSIGAYWEHDGSLTRPHALLTKGGHSKVYFNGSFVTENPRVLSEVVNTLTDLFSDHLRLFSDHLCRKQSIGIIDRVVGPAFGAITLAHAVAREISIRSKTECLSSFVQPFGGYIKGLHFGKGNMNPGESVLLVDDVITTGGSIMETENAVENAGGRVLPVVFALVNKSGKDEINGKKIIALINRRFPVWDAEDCPLCRTGSPAIRPKDNNGENWKRLISGDV